MIYLLDVNALIALGFLQHEFNHRIAARIQMRRSMKLATCSITEIGFVRILSANKKFGITIDQARSLLLSLKTGSTLQFQFIDDDQDIENLPAWARFASQVTDAHLVQLAAAHSMTLATFDEKIPGAFLIP